MLRNEDFSISIHLETELFFIIFLSISLSESPPSFYNCISGGGGRRDVTTKLQIYNSEGKFESMTIEFSGKRNQKNERVEKRRWGGGR